MQLSSQDVFYLMSDLTDAFADLSLAMRKWHKEQEKLLTDADNDSLLASLQAIQIALGQPGNHGK